MALDKATLKSSIKSALLAAAAEEDPDNFDAAMDSLAGNISDAVDAFVKSGTVTTTVTTVVIGTLPVGPVAATGSGAGTGSMT